MTRSEKMESIMRELQPKLLGALKRMLNNEEAEEVTQETFLRLHLSAKIIPDLEIQPYAFKIARNLAIGRLRHESVRRKNGPKLSIHYEMDFVDDSVEKELTDVREKAVLLAAINSLPPACRQVFIYRKIDEKPHSEIARLMGISVNTVENHLARGMKLCREFIIALDKQAPSAGHSEQKVS